MGGIQRTAIALAVATVTMGMPGRAAVILDSLLIRVYDNAGVLAAHRARAIKSADDIIGRAGVPVEWHDCPARAALIRAACASPSSRGDLVIRLVRSPKRDPNERALGHAYIDPSSGSGTLATVFVDRVEALAGQARADGWALVGRVMAHEVGHLLLGTNAHSDTGLMREFWTVKDLVRNRPDDWVFSRSQREGLQSGRLTARNASPSSNAAAGG
jgi:hypothetical protein